MEPGARMTSSRRSGPRKAQAGQGCAPAAESPDFERARLLQLEQRRTEQLRGLAEAALAINASLSLDEALQTITERARLIIGAHQAVTSFTIGQDWAQSINTVSLSDKYAAYRGYDAQPNGTGIYRWSVWRIARTVSRRRSSRRTRPGAGSARKRNATRPCAAGSPRR